MFPDQMQVLNAILILLFIPIFQVKWIEKQFYQFFRPLSTQYGAYSLK
jgi:dipeptide/tripeptide permease